MDRNDRLKQLFAMLELNLKRELTHEERRLLALSDYCFDEEERGPADPPRARGNQAAS